MTLIELIYTDKKISGNQLDQRHQRSLNLKTTINQSSIPGCKDSGFPYHQEI
jgi:hypothetical protein